MKTNVIGFSGFQKYLRPCALDESSLSIGSVKTSAKDIVMYVLLVTKRQACMLYCTSCP